MAYVDLVSSGVTLVAGGASYDFAFDSPVSADNSPHLTHIGIQLDLTVAGAPIIASTMSHLVDQYRLKVGANEIINFNDPASAVAGADIGNLGVMCQKVGGVDSINSYSATGILTELTFPVGIDATKSHRINVHLQLLDEALWCAQALTPATSELNIVCYYGTTTESVIFGSRQDYQMTDTATRTVTIYGKKGWQMLGVFMVSGTAATDEWTRVRVNNGAFRELRLAEWRIIEGTGWKAPLRYIDAAGSPTWRTAQAGIVFIDLKRLSAGASIDMAVTSSANGPTSFFPVWVSAIGKGTGKAPSQTAKTVQSTTADVIDQSEN